MIDPNDSFGQTMVQNLKERGCDLLGLDGCPDINSQVQRMKDSFQTEEVECFSMDHVYQNKLDQQEKARIEKLELFDEFEEWTLLQSHYCLCFAKRVATAAAEQAKSVHL